MAHRLSCSASGGIFPDQGSNPCPLHWQADSFFFFFLLWGRRRAGGGGEGKGGEEGRREEKKVSPAGRFLTTVPPGMSRYCDLTG